jgi:arylformamidase
MSSRELAQIDNLFTAQARNWCYDAGMPTIYDITRKIAPSSAVWQGDTPYSVHLLADQRRGSSVNLTTLTLSAHSATHADARFHYQADGATVDGVPLEPFIGPARVVSVEQRTGAITPADLAHVDLRGGQRLLIRTFVSSVPDEQLITDFPAFSAALIEHLAELEYVLVGTDAISVDPYTSTTLEAHHALARHGLYNLESICLAGVPDGDYELIALPLKLSGACASPVRAILRPLRGDI